MSYPIQVKLQPGGCSCMRGCVLGMVIPVLVLAAVLNWIQHGNEREPPRQTRPASAPSAASVPFARQPPWPHFEPAEPIGKVRECQGVTAVDLDRDGSRDVVAWQSKGPVVAFLRRGKKWERRELGAATDALVAGEQLALPAANKLSVTLKPSGKTIPGPSFKVRSGTCAAGDANGDGAPDFVLAGYDGQWGLLLSRAKGGHEAKILDVPAHITDVAIEGGQVLLATDKGVFGCSAPFTQEKQLPQLGKPQVWRWGDLDGDGSRDLLALGEDFGSYWVSKPLSAEPARHDFPEYSMVSPTGVGDLDGDGDNDVVAVGAGSTVVLRNDGDGRFSRQRADTKLSNPEYVGDVNGDGHADILELDLESRNLVLLRVKRVLAEEE